MGIIKDNNYSKEELQFAQIGRALSHPVRRKIIDQLQIQLITKNTDLSKMFNLSVPCIAEHLEKLMDAELIKATYVMHYHEIALNPDGFEVMREYLNSLNSKFSNLE